MKRLYPKFVVSFFFLFSCSKVNISHQELPSYLQLPSSADARLFPLIDSIWHYEHHRPVISSIVSTYGLVRWDKSLIGCRGKTLVAVIPVSSKDMQYKRYFLFENGKIVSFLTTKQGKVFLLLN